MPLPKPTPGLVIHHEYLWRHEAMAGADKGVKRRPVAIIVAITGTAGAVSVTVAPIIHTPPAGAASGILLPAKVKQHLGLDADPSWVITNDLNIFVWPGEDLYPVPNTPPGTYDYGFLPPALFDQIRQEILRHSTAPPLSTGQETGR